MDNKELLEQHQPELRDLCREYWRYATSSAPADRERLESAIARVYEAHDLQAPHVMWVDSLLDAKCCAAICSFISDPQVHFSMTGAFGRWKGQQGPVLNSPLLPHSFCGTGLIHARRRNRQRNYSVKLEDEYKVLLKSQFPTLYTETEAPESVALTIWRTFLQLSMDDDIPYFEWNRIVSGAPAPAPFTMFPPRTPIASFTVLDHDSWRNPASAEMLEDAARIFHGVFHDIIERFSGEDWLDFWRRYKGQTDRWDLFGPNYLEKSELERAEVDRFLSRIAGLESLGCFNPLGDALTCAKLQARDVLGLAPIPKAQPLIETVKAGGWWWPFEGICIAIDNPFEVHLDDRHRLHNEDGMAMRFSDMWNGFWSLNGIRVSQEIATRQFSFADILAERNAEIRRVMINRYGLSSFISDSEARKVAEDEFGILFRKILDGREVVNIVEVINKTPEPDGTFKVYHLLVPPEINTAKEGVAWSFGMTAEEYDPVLES